MRFAGVAVLSMLALAGVDAQVSAPLLGWLPEDAQIRPMRGLPGAAMLGAAVNTGHRLTNITVSPQQNYVLAGDAQSGEVLLIVPGGSVSTLAATAKPETIAVSPRGSAALLWYPGSGNFEILSGLPSNPAVRTAASSLSGPVAAMAVSDDGQWFAAASSSGVYVWGSNGVATQVYSGGDAAALAFYPGGSNLAVATSTQVLAVDGTSASVLYQGSFAPKGIGVSADGQSVILADGSGSIYSITGLGATVTQCQCQPGGVFGLGGSLFRLTSSAVGPVKLIDASSGAAIYTVPRVSNAPNRQMAAHPAQASGPLPNITMTVSPTPTGYLQQPAITLAASSTYPDQISGNITLTFTPATTNAQTNTDDTIVFANGLTQVNFIIPLGSTQALFEGSLPSITFSTGSTAGTIALAVNITSPTAVSSVATASYTTTPAVPSISGVSLAQTPGGVTITITGYSSTVDVSSATFNFSLSGNASITTNNITVNVSPYFEAYYLGGAAVATGTEFTLQVPFGIVGNPNDITGVSVVVLNSKGLSAPVNSK